jgi:hypothetical protein
MVARASCVALLASEAAVDLDEALAALWDAGLDFVEDANSLIPGRSTNGAG